MPKFRFTIRSALIGTIIVAAFCGANVRVDYNASALEERELVFTPKNMQYKAWGSETPELVNSRAEWSTSITDYLLLRRSVKLTGRVQMIYSGVYGGGFGHRVPGSQDRFIGCTHRYSVGLINSELVSSKYYIDLSLADSVPRQNWTLPYQTMQNTGRFYEWQIP